MNSRLQLLLFIIMALGVSVIAGAQGSEVLNVVLHRGPEAKILSKRIQSYDDEHPDLRIEVEILDEYPYWPRLRERLDSDNPPDLFEIDAPNVAEAAFRGFLRPLEPVLLEIADEFYPAMLEQGTFNGVLYTLPTYNSSVALYYNKSLVCERLVREAGIERGYPDSLNTAWTFEELQAILEKYVVGVDLCGSARQGEERKYGLLLDMDTVQGGADELLTFLYLPIVYSKTTEIMSDVGYKLSGYLNSARATDALSWFQELIHDPRGLVLLEPLSIESDWVHDPQNPRNKIECNKACCKGEFDYLSAFKSGKVAMLWHGHWKYNELEKCLEDNLGVAPLPYFRDGNRASPFGSYSWAMHIKSQQRTVGSGLIRYLTSPETQKDAIEKGGGALPATRKGMDAIDIYKIAKVPGKTPMEVNDRLVFVLQSEKTAIPRPKTPVYEVFTSRFAHTLRQLARDRNADAQALLDDTAEVTDRYMREQLNAY